MPLRYTKLMDGRTPCGAGHRRRTAALRDAVRRHALAPEDVALATLRAAAAGKLLRAIAELDATLPHEARIAV